MKDFSILLNPEQDLYHSGYLISAAVSAGARLRIDRRASPFVPLIMFADVEYAIDLVDSSRSYNHEILATSDFYLKRSYVKSHAPVSHRKKIFPFGLNYACRTRQSLLRLLGLYGLHFTQPGNPKTYMQLPVPEAFETGATGPVDDKILFQTRLWAPAEVAPTDNAEGLNRFRVDLVRELRRTFKYRFIGGLVPNKESSAYPDLLTEIPHRRTAYAVNSRAPAIGIYTRGLHESNAFKMAEYLASCKCIVGQSLAHELPEPLGECHAVGETVGEIIAECEAVLSNPHRLLTMRRASRRYYESNIRYDRRMQLLFDGHAFRSA